MEVIKNWEELGNFLDDLDCRIYALEQAQLPSNYSLYQSEEREPTNDDKPITNTNVIYQVDGKSADIFKQTARRAIKNENQIRFLKGQLISRRHKDVL